MRTVSQLALTPCASLRSAGPSRGFDLRYRLSQFNEDVLAIIVIGTSDQPC